MANISDIIESFLLETLGEDDSLNISRNELASYFSVAPSQINYVLSTRFTPAKGYSIESRRGGGGFITVVRLHEPKSELVMQIMQRPLSQGYNYPTACHIIDRLVADELFTEREGIILKASLSDKALIAPTVLQKDSLRLSILKSVVGETLKST
ncbi:MAG: CtsR family transcriptional regulator [Clostridia bacterium]|nr:CtsR family transcriptional regulator [Clostridia bacterium]